MYIIEKELVQGNRVETREIILVVNEASHYDLHLFDNVIWPRQSGHSFFHLNHSLKQFSWKNDYILLRNRNCCLDKFRKFLACYWLVLEPQTNCMQLENTGVSFIYSLWKNVIDFSSLAVYLTNLYFNLLDLGKSDHTDSDQ